MIRDALGSCCCPPSLCEIIWKSEREIGQYLGITFVDKPTNKSQRDSFSCTCDPCIVFETGCRFGEPSVGLLRLLVMLEQFSWSVPAPSSPSLGLSPPERWAASFGRAASSHWNRPGSGVSHSKLKFQRRLSCSMISLSFSFKSRRSWLWSTGPNKLLQTDSLRLVGSILQMVKFLVEIVVVHSALLDTWLQVDLKAAGRKTFLFVHNDKTSGWLLERDSCGVGVAGGDPIIVWRTQLKHWIKAPDCVC